MILLPWSTLAIFVTTHCATAKHIIGAWNSELATPYKPIHLIAKFGFQRTDTARIELTRGYIFGNITTSELGEPLLKNQPRDQWLYMVLLNQQMYHSLQPRLNSRSSSCQNVMSEIASFAFHIQCNTNGSMDLFRKVPCALGQVCPDEDQPDLVISSAQFTYRIQEPYAPGYWYLTLTTCYIDTECHWRRRESFIKVAYDIWLINGAPESKNIFAKQFSFPEQNSLEIFIMATIFFAACSLVQYRCVHVIGRYSLAAKRCRFLFYILMLESFSSFALVIHYYIYGLDGIGLMSLQRLGSMFYIVAINGLSVLLILLANGHCVLPPLSMTDSFSYNRTTLYKYIMCFIATSILHYVLYYLSEAWLDDAAESYGSWPENGIAVLRLSYMIVFMVSLRNTVHRCSRRNEYGKAEFLTNFGAAFLVWFIYRPIVAAFGTFIEPLWRFKLLLGLNYLGDFSVACLLVHAFWPRSENAKHFCDFKSLTNLHGMTSTDDYIDDFERELISPTDGDTDVDFSRPMMQFDIDMSTEGSMR